jgi:hypothetical protein
MRFGYHWPVLYAHLVLFRYVYPDQRDRVPPWVVEELMRRSAEPQADVRPVCRGTLLSREQYLHDLAEFGYEDARLSPEGCMSPEEVEIWTSAIERK